MLSYSSVNCDSSLIVSAVYESYFKVSPQPIPADTRHRITQNCRAVCVFPSREFVKVKQRVSLCLLRLAYHVSCRASVC